MAVTHRDNGTIVDRGEWYANNSGVTLISLV